MKKLSIIFLIFMLYAFNAQAFTVFYEPVANKQGQYRILNVLPDTSNQKFNIAAFDEKTQADLDLMNCVIEWNINRKIDRYFITVNVDGTKSLIENKDFFINMAYKSIDTICKPVTTSASKPIPVNDKVAITVNEAPTKPESSADEATYQLQQLYKSEQIQWVFGWLRRALENKDTNEIYQKLKEDMSKDPYSRAIINMIDALTNTTKISDCPPMANADNCTKIGCKDCPIDEFGGMMEEVNYPYPFK